MALYEVTEHSIRPIAATTFASQGIKERDDLQRLVTQAIDVVAPGCLVLAEEFCEWEDSKRRIDLLCLDEDANLVVVEFKRDDEGAHMDLQALRYAAMVSGMTFDSAARVFRKHLAAQGKDATNAERQILDFLGWSTPTDGPFATDVRAVLVSGDFGKELTTCVMWLNSRGLDVRCVRLRPHELDGRVLLDVQQVIPLPEAAEYQVRLKEKAEELRQGAKERGPWTGAWFVNVGEDGKNGRSWEDCRKYGFVSAGGGPTWRDQVCKLQTGDEVLVYLSGYGYVGAGRVLAAAAPIKDFVSPVAGKKLTELPLEGRIDDVNLDDPETTEWCAPVQWTASVAREQAFPAAARRQAVCRLYDAGLVASVRTNFAPPK